MRCAAILLLAAAAGAAEVRIALRPAVSLPAREVVLAEVAELSGDAQGIAALSGLPVLTQRSLVPVRLDERRIRAAVGRHAAAWPLVITGAALVSPPPRRFASDALEEAAVAAIDPQGDRIEAKVVRSPAELVVPDLGEEVGLQAEPLDRSAWTGEVPVRVVARCGGLELGRGLVAVQVRRWRRVLVATMPLARGQVVAPEAVRLDEVAVDRRHLDALGDPGLAVGRVVNRDLRAGDPVPRWAVDERPAVAAGRPVTLVFRRNGLELTTAAEAMGTGRIGDRVHVRRTDGLPVSGRIAADGVVVIGE